MTWIAEKLWLIPALPLIAAGVGAFMKQGRGRASAGLAVLALLGSFLLSVLAFVATLSPPPGESLFREQASVAWLRFGDETLRLGWVLDPLTAVMLLMVTFVALLVFIYSVGYMEHDERFTRFFCFLSMFAAAMLGIVIANSLLLLFIAWELVGLASYLLIGFWCHKPAAAAAAKKAFLTTRFGDIGFFIGLLWLYSETGTLLFYDNGNGCLENKTLTKLISVSVLGGMAISTAISLLIACGAFGKSGQMPFHIWLPDAMEGPTPVSALIHAATMVAAGVFLLARIYPLMDAVPMDMFKGSAELPGTALQLVTWIGAFTAIYAALSAIAQTDIKRILAYSTISQLGFMMVGLGTGGVAVALFHLITHAFFKALLFLGAGSLIHGNSGEQDIRNMGGLRQRMPITFAVYAVGMMALSGVPLLSGFWSKDAILHSAHTWPLSQIPFWLVCSAAVLTAFYMTRQMSYVFGHREEITRSAAHESPAIMIVPMMILAIFAAVLGLLGTPAWPWLETYLSGQTSTFSLARLAEPQILGTMTLSTCLVVVGGFFGWLIYRRVHQRSMQRDPIEQRMPRLFRLLSTGFFADRFYDCTLLRVFRALVVFAGWLEATFLGGVIRVVAGATSLLSWITRGSDEHLINLGFDQSCDSMRETGSAFARVQNGRIQTYLRYIGLALVVLALALVWGWLA